MSFTESVLTRVSNSENWKNIDPKDQYSSSFAFQRVSMVLRKDIYSGMLTTEAQDALASLITWDGENDTLPFNNRAGAMVFAITQLSRSATTKILGTSYKKYLATLLGEVCFHHEK